MMSKRLAGESTRQIAYKPASVSKYRTRREFSEVIR